MTLISCLLTCAALVVVVTVPGVSFGQSAASLQSSIDEIAEALRVGDRGLKAKTQIEALLQNPGISPAARQEAEGHLRNVNKEIEDARAVLRGRSVTELFDAARRTITTSPDVSLTFEHKHKAEFAVDKLRALYTAAGRDPVKHAQILEKLGKLVGFSDSTTPLSHSAPEANAGALIKLANEVEEMK